MDNLVAIFSMNHLGHSGALPLQHWLDIYQKHYGAFPWVEHFHGGWLRRGGSVPGVAGNSSEEQAHGCSCYNLQRWGTPNIEDAEN